MYCSIQEAFETNTPAPAAGKRKKQREGFREKREKFQNPDPDRPANVALPPADFVGGGIQQPSYSNILTATDAGADTSYFSHPSQDSQENPYMLEPDWTKQFDGPSVPPWIQERFAAKEAEIPLKPSWVDGQPTLWQKIPAAYTPSPPPAPNSPSYDLLYSDLDSRFNGFESRMESKLDQMFVKLNDLEKSKSESNHIEIILFIIGGLFLLLMLDMLVKQGMKATMMLAAAGGGHAVGGALRTLLA
jgi:hypothetical protein